MEVTITLEHRFKRATDGTIWTQTMFPYSLWKRYLAVFDHVNVAARLEDSTEIDSQWFRADGDGVSFIPIPYYLGLNQYIQQAQEISRRARDIISDAHAVILRIPSHIAPYFWSALHMTGHPYGIEAVGDAYDCYAPGAIHHPLRPFFRLIFAHQMRQQCWHACAVSYVSRQALSSRFPVAPGTFSIGCSDVQLDHTWILPQARQILATPSPTTLITVGSLSQMYKAPDILLQAMALCRQQNHGIRLKLIGDGRHRPGLELLAQTLGVTHDVQFLGQLSSGDAIRQQLDSADLFVMPSRTEGLPRAMIEAMARGLPCIGSTVGGIPELLAAEDCVRPGDAPALADKILEVLDSPERMTRMSARNIARATEYVEEKLVDRRLEFLTHLREETARWLIRYPSKRLAA